MTFSLFPHFLITFVIIMVVLINSTIQARGPHHPRGEKIVKHHVHYRPTKGKEEKLTQDKQLLQDKEHIEEHLEAIVPEIDVSNFTEEELEFHYFNLHDMDKNSKLDGLEILEAIRHTAHDTHDNPEDVEEHAVLEDFEYYVELIDRVLEEDDTNNDGFLSYPEYVAGRKKDMTEKNKRIIAGPTYHNVKASEMSL